MLKNVCMYLKTFVVWKILFIRNKIIYLFDDKNKNCNCIILWLKKSIMKIMNFNSMD